MNSDLVRWRLEKAEITFQEGLLLYNGKHFHGAVNRFYYSCFHAARAVLATKGYDAPKHSGIISLFNKHFVKEGIFGKHISKTITIVFSERSDADYNDLKCFEEEEVEKIKSDVRILIDEIHDYLNPQHTETR